MITNLNFIEITVLHSNQNTLASISPITTLGYSKKQNVGTNEARSVLTNSDV
jgi:hypothetical protein